MQVRFKDTDLDRLESDARFSAGHSPAIVRAFRKTMQRIRAANHTRLQPVVILTSSDEARDRLRSYDLGANSYICKPVDFAEFNSTVESLGGYWTRLNKTPED